MKLIGIFLGLCIWLTACSAPATVVPTPPPPTFAPVALAQTTNAPTPTLDPRFTPTPSVTPQPTATQPVVLTPVPQISYPAVFGKIKLLDLPGEGRGPGALAQLGDALYVANRLSKNIAVVKQDRATSFIPLGLTPTALTAEPARNRIYAGTSETPTLFVLENDAVTRQIGADGRINALVAHGDTLYVALDNGPLIERYDTATLTKKDELKLSQGFAVSSLVLDEPRKRLYAGEYGKIVAIDLDTFQELATLDVPDLYSRFAVSPADGSIWSGAYEDSTSRAYLVGFAPDGKELARLYVGSDLTAVTVDDANNLYVTDSFNNQVYVVQTPSARLVATIAVNEGPEDALFEARRGTVFVSNHGNDNLSAIDAKSHQVTRVIPLAGTINALAANPLRKRVYAASGSTNSVFVIENDQLIGEVSTGMNPVDLAVDAAANRVYVAASADGVLSVIDEDSLKVQHSVKVGRYLFTVAVDSANKKIFAGNAVLNPETLEPETVFFANGITLDSKNVPDHARANPALQKLYALASNGVPGSNARLTLYRFLYADMSDSKMLGSKIGGNTTAIAIDPTTNNLFATNSHPLAYTHGLDIFDAQDNLVETLGLASHTSSLVVNPETHHLFLAHAQTYQPFLRTPPPQDNTVEILDTRTLGHVATLGVPGSPWRMTRIENKIYVAALQDGSVHILGDAMTAKPAPPTPTLTATPFPTWTPAPDLAQTPTAQANGNIACSFGPPAPFAALWVERLTELGCPTDVAVEGNFAVQTFKDGYMYDDLRNPAAQKIYVLFPDHTYKVFDDTWHEGEEERPCNDVEIPEGRIHPKRGFGKVWCENADVQEKLPGAVADESGLTLTIQDFEHGMMWSNTPQGVITFLQDGTWR